MTGPTTYRGTHAGYSLDACLSTCPSNLSLETARFRHLHLLAQPERELPPRYNLLHEVVSAPAWCSGFYILSLPGTPVSVVTNPRELLKTQLSCNMLMLK